MKKVALVVMLLASSTFGAALVAPAQVDGSSGTAVITLGIVNDLAAQTGGEGLFGYSLAATTGGKAAMITGRTNLLALDGITDPTNPDSGVLNKQLASVADLGFTGTAGVSAVTRSGDILTLTLAVAPADLPITVNWTGTLVSTFFSEFPVSGSTQIIAIPEPISALLLGLGTLFFARRRRA